MNTWLKQKQKSVYSKLKPQIKQQLIINSLRVNLLQLAKIVYSIHGSTRHT